MGRKGGRQKTKTNKLAVNDFQKSKNYLKAKRIFITAEVVLVLVPFVFLLMASMLVPQNSSFIDFMRTTPQMLAGFLVSMMQPFVALQLRYVFKAYGAGSFEKSAVQLMALCICELCMQQVLGIFACLFCLWSIWRGRCIKPFAWMKQQGFAATCKALGALFVLFAMSLLCGFVLLRAISLSA